MQTKEIIKVYSEKAAKELKDALLKYSLKKKVQGDGEFEVVATTDGVDRDGEMIKVDGWDFENYKKNPVLLWGHDYSSLPIGAVTDLSVEGGKVIAKGVFAKSEFAQEVRALYDDGFIKTVSVGFIPHERTGSVITKAELLELSFVSVPANPDALDRLKSFEKKYMQITLKSDEEIREEEKKNNEEAPAELEQQKEESSTGQVSESLIAEYPKGEEQEKAYIEEKEGRVLSSKNRTLVSNAIEALQALLNASEPPQKSILEVLSDVKKQAQLVDKVNESILRNLKSIESKV